MLELSIDSCDRRMKFFVKFSLDMACDWLGAEENCTISGWLVMSVLFR